MTLRHFNSQSHVGRQQSGAVAIEFALIFPIFLLIFYGIICYSVILLHKQTLANITGEAARSAVAVTEIAAMQGEIQDVINGYAWIAGRVEPCDDWSGLYYNDATPGKLQLCMSATLPRDPALPTINLSAFGLPILPPEEEEILRILRSEFAVNWMPSL